MTRRQIWAVMALWTLTAAAWGESPLKDLPATPPQPPPPTVTRAGVQAALPVLEKLIEDTLQATGVPGASVVVVHQDEVVYLKGFGVRRVGQPERVDADTVFQLASLSKAVSATVVSALVGDGVVRWDDPVVKHDPSFALADPWVTSHATLADLFSHRSGLPDHAGDLLEDLGYDRDEILARLRYQPLSPFRIHYDYTNFGLTAAAVAAARAAGSSWEDLARTRLFEPLGMTSTTARFAEFQAFPNRAVGHVPVDGRWEPRYVREPDAQSPAGGVASSARDLGRWLRLQLAEGRFEGRQVVEARALAQTHAPQIVNNPPRGSYGLGWLVGIDQQGRVRLSHSGAFDLGAATAVLLIPHEEVGIIVLTNGRPVGVPEAITWAFADLVVDGRIERDWVTLGAQAMRALLATEGPDYSLPPTSPAPPPNYGTLVGTYANEYYGPLQVVEQDGGPVLLLGPDPLSFPLRPWDGNVFVFETRGENAVGLTGVTFSGDTVTVDYLNKTGLGTFTRKP